jgi:hypothetical protein
MDDDILDIKLLPAWSPSSVKRELQSALGRSQLLQASIAYWTVSDRLFGPLLSQALGDASGFVCVDLHLPTDIDALATVVRRGAHVRWYCEDIATYADSGRKEPPCLLHSKMLLFWSKDGTAELWVGSHNWTNRAIAGLNVESSLIVRMRHSSRLFADAADYLQKIRSISHEFDLSRIDSYKQTQQALAKPTKAFIELEAQNASSLDNITIRLFGTDASDQRQLSTVGDRVWLSVFDSESEEECLYPATILHSGVMPAFNPAAGGLTFPEDRYAFRRGHRFPALLPKGPVDAAVYTQAHYFVTLELSHRDESVVAEYPRPKVDAWVEVHEGTSPLLERLDADARQVLFGGGHPQPMRPRFQVEGQVEVSTSTELTLAERRNQAERPLVTRRTLRRKRIAAP